MYLFATQNAADFVNLLVRQESHAHRRLTDTQSMNLDATFFPLLNELDFLQEGHRWEFVTDEEGKKPKKQQKAKLGLNGVVFNEMKGAMVRSSHPPVNIAFC